MEEILDSFSRPFIYEKILSKIYYTRNIIEIEILYTKKRIDGRESMIFSFSEKISLVNFSNSILLLVKI